MELKIHDSFTVAASSKSISAADWIRSQILESIKSNTPNIEILSERPIIFQRPMRQGGFAGIKSFSSGKILITNIGDNLSVEYELGIGSYLYLMLFAPGVGVLLYLKHWSGLDIFFAVAAMLALSFARLLYNKGNVREWLKAIVGIALSRAGNGHQ